ncbi:hypothetical protein SAMN05216389_11875 [Oceanobacillus limi]|uniref:Permuted papain-like amidase enzyme, YaeF/YiiX, C92 family n=1 Tax=Oceanobacillus limi TaxID=930131 RepID=A0A1I0G4R9_9BACI|nr:hypothetical protein [Oceanobacillus limi]SET65023.1 hypothetical protein SAMN05216389_11875 [Oceanobacillus limi]
MERHFNVWQENEWVKIKQITDLPFNRYDIYVNDELEATYYRGNSIYIYIGNRRKVNRITIIGFYHFNGVPMGWLEPYQFMTSRDQQERDFLPGDILVASDNVVEFFTGYVGHSAIVVDGTNVIEARGGTPTIQKDSIQQFLEKHPHHAQFRPKSLEMGKAAAAYAENYLRDYQEKVSNGEDKPLFSMKLTQSLEDPWEYIYCSKLVWLSYYYGANYKLENDYLWISPEDLYTNLKENDAFINVYQHEEVEFKVNT